MREFFLSSPAERPLAIDYKGELNGEQYDVVENGDGPCLVLAGAGSGKTRTVTYRVAWLLEHGVPPDRILLLTFTNKAAKEMVTRIEALLKTYPQGLWAGTFHSVANRLLRMYGDRTPFGRNFSILDEEDATDLMKLCMKEEKAKSTGERFPSAAVLKNVISYAVNARVSVPEILEARYTSLLSYVNEIVAIAGKFSREKERQRAMDFDDLLSQLLHLLKTDDTLRAALAEKFAYVIVDEFQDTNVLQAEIVDLVSSAHRNVLVVGDDAQSIYSFRAAEIKNILEFPKRYEGSRTFRLVTNYRSTPEILTVANAVITHNTEQFQKNLHAVVAPGEKPCLVPAADDRQEAQYITEQILALMDEGARLQDIAVLFRAAFHSQGLEFELMKRNIPYEYRGGLKFFERAHIKDALAHLRLMQNVKDRMAWMRILQLQPGFGVVTAGRAADYFAQTENVEDAVLSLPPFSEKVQLGWRKAKDVLGAMFAQNTPAEMLRAFAGSEGYRTYLEAEYPNARDRMEDLEQFALFAEQYQELGPFLDAVTLSGDFGVRVDDLERAEKDEGGEDRLILSTIHQAKGLEWENVFILHLAEGFFPHERAYGEEGGLSEERRLFYVAVTRARKRLFFTYPITSGYEHVEIRQASQFVKEIPSDAVEEVRLRAVLPSWAMQAPGKRQSSRGSDGWPDDEPTIVLDASGETVKKKEMPKSFLRDIDEM